MTSAAHGAAQSEARQAGTFWDDLAEDLQDAEFLREYVAESVRIATVDLIVNTLDEARENAGLSKAALARSISQPPAAIRRLFSQEHPNPTLGTLAEVAAALGMRLTLEPLAPEERLAVTDSLLQGAAPRDVGVAEVARQLQSMRGGDRAVVPA